MTDDQDSQPNRPHFRGQRYDENLQQAKEEVTRPLFNINITASIKQKGHNMIKIDQPKEPQFHIELVFKPIEKGFTLRPEETQLLLAYMDEILKEVETEERRIIEEQKIAQTDEVPSCK